MVLQWRMISMQTARRSFATILRKHNLPDITVMKLTGHKSVVSFERYIRLENEKAIEDYKTRTSLREKKTGQN